MFFKHSKTVILWENGHQHDAEEEKVNKIQRFSKKIPASWTCLSERRQLDQIYVYKS
jgi:hypothetical protein